MIRVIDNFLPDWNELREFSDGATFADIANPVDGVVYPGICVEIPRATRHEVSKRLSTIHGQAVNLKTLFMRLSPQGTVAPHQAHTDSTMGQYSMMLYMNRQHDAHGGTSLLRHKATGMTSDENLTPFGQQVWQRDTNNYNAWSIYRLVSGQPNRAFVFDSRLFHRAEPVTGYGHNQKNGRLVLTAFYDLGEPDAYSIRNSK